MAVVLNDLYLAVHPTFESLFRMFYDVCKCNDRILSFPGVVSDLPRLQSSEVDAKHRQVIAK